MTFSISARCPQTGMLGMAISSSSPAVAARCAHAEAGVGVVASQNITDPVLGINGLVLMKQGKSALDARDELVQSTPYARFRQLALVDSEGRTAGFSGSAVLGIHAVTEGKDCIAAGNLLSNDAVPAAMVAAFATSREAFPLRLLVALEAGLAAGGEAGPVYSAGLKVVREVSWPVVDLRVDWSENPIQKLTQIWGVYAPQLEDYVRRAVNPEAAPSFGVPGDE
jgi:uncharacterized Ntn-hydrolase superfamily protein